MKNHSIFSTLSSTIWALQPEYLTHLQASALAFVRGGDAAAQAHSALEQQAAIEAARRQQISASTGGSVVVLPLYGLITQRSSWWSYGGTTTEGFTMQLRQAIADPNVTAIVIDVDSPGGSVAGVDELADEIYAARSKKTIIAISNTLNASAAYFLSSQASELYVAPSSLTGSIGVYNAHQDISGYLAQIGVKITMISAGRYKTEGNQFEPLDATAQAAQQKLVDGYYSQFVAAVARGRKAKLTAVKGGYGEGRVVMAEDAIELGMADKIGTLDTVLARFGVQRNAQDSFMQVAEVKPPTAEAQAAPVEAAKKKDSTSDDDPEDGTGTDETNDGTCACDCDGCTAGDCGDCSKDDCSADGCTCKKMKADKKEKAEHALRLELQRRRIALAL